MWNRGASAPVLVTYTKWWLEGAVLAPVGWLDGASVLAAWPSATSIADSVVSGAFALVEVPAEPLFAAPCGTVRRDRRSSFTAIASHITGLSNEKLLSYSWIEPS